MALPAPPHPRPAPDASPAALPRTCTRVSGGRTEMAEMLQGQALENSVGVFVHWGYSTPHVLPPGDPSFPRRLPISAPIALPGKPLVPTTLL